MKCFTKILDEAALIVSGNTIYPKFNNILIMAGGAGSGKSFVLSTVLGFTGKVFDVDKLKSDIIKLSKKKHDLEINKQYYNLYNKNLYDIDLKNPEDVANLHLFLKNTGLDDARKQNIFKTAKDTKNKPNIIFDVTLKDTEKLKEISEYADYAGYDKKNIHIVWVCVDIQLARKRNQERERSVSDSIILKTHSGVSKTMSEIIKESSVYQKYIDGDIWIVFNVSGVDNTYDIGTRNTCTNMIPMVLKNYTALHIKERGKPAKKLDSINKELLTKLQKYTSSDSWK